MILSTTLMYSGADWGGGLDSEMCGYQPGDGVPLIASQPPTMQQHTVCTEIFAICSYWQNFYHVNICPVLKRIWRLGENLFH